MREFVLFDPSSGSGTLETYGINVNEQIVIYNDSIYRIRFTFPDKSVGVVPALWAKDYIIKTVAIGKVKWEVLDQLNITSNPFIGVYGEVYEADEHVDSINASMQRSVVSSIPGGVSTSVVSLESTGANISPDGTNIITITDSLGNTFILDNNGVGQWLIKVGAALVNIIKSQSSDNPLVQLAAAGHLIEVLGNLKVDGTLETIGNITADGGMNINSIRDNVSGTLQLALTTAGVTVENILTLLAGLQVASDINTTSGGYKIANNLIVSAATNTHIAAPPSGQVIFDVTGTAAAGLVDARGVVSNGTQGFTFPSGGFLPNLSFFTGAATGTYNHGFGSAPFWVAPITQVAGSQTQGYDTVTSTQVHVTIGAALSFKAGCF